MAVTVQCEVWSRFTDCSNCVLWSRCTHCSNCAVEVLMALSVQFEVGIQMCKVSLVCTSLSSWCNLLKSFLVFTKLPAMWSMCTDCSNCTLWCPALGILHLMFVAQIYVIIYAIRMSFPSLYSILHLFYSQIQRKYKEILFKSAFPIFLVQIYVIIYAIRMSFPSL